MPDPDPGHRGAAAGTSRHRRTGRLTVLLAALVALLVVPAILPLGRASQMVVELLLTVTAVAAALEIGTSKAFLVLGASVAAAAVVAHLATWIWPGSRAGLVAAQFLVVVLFSLLIWRVGQDVVHARVVTADVLRGAVAIYLLLGLSWSFLYRMTDALDPKAFSMPAVTVSSDTPTASGNLRRNETFLYFSFVTLTTLGYGDVTPRSRPARTLAWLEAMVGQLYIAVTVAGLVALNVSHRRREEDD